MTITPESPEAERDLHASIAEVPMWYHSIELAPGVVTPGRFDLRPSVGRLPWPQVRGRRCLDVGTSDGFLAFELERRGAGEVVATDIGSHEEWDWEEHLHGDGPAYLRHVSGPTTGIGFAAAHRALASRVQRRELSVYQLSPETVGTFDVVVCGSLLLHLRDPVAALAAIRSVCAGELLCTNQVELGLSLLHRRRPLMRLDGTSGLAQWWLPSVAGQRQLLRAAGFEIIAESGLYPVRFGPSHPPRSRRPRWLLRAILQRTATGAEGVPHCAMRARPANPGPERDAAPSAPPPASPGAPPPAS